MYCNKAYGYRDPCARQWTPQTLWGAYGSGTYSVFQCCDAWGREIKKEMREKKKNKKKKSIWLCESNMKSTMSHWEDNHGLIRTQAKRSTVIEENNKR